MIECYALPTALPYNITCKYRQFVKGVKYQDDQTLDHVVFYGRTGQLETGLLGIKYFAQISKSIMSNKPGLQDLFIIDDKTYQILSVVDKRNPGFVEFWECEIKSRTKTIV
jgi:hypothetical protein